MFTYLSVIHFGYLFGKKNKQGIKSNMHGKKKQKVFFKELCAIIEEIENYL